MAEYNLIEHPIPPLYRSDSEILILGSFPSVKSREQCFFYGHPQNRFWRVMAEVFGAPVPKTIDEKRVFLLSHRVAVWDVIYSCEIKGSSDSSIRNAVPTDLCTIIRDSHIRKIFCNGKTSFSMYEKYQKKLTGMDAVCLPSTSPANAAWTLEKLAESWRVILD